MESLLETTTSINHMLIDLMDAYHNLSILMTFVFSFCFYQSFLQACALPFPENLCSYRSLHNAHPYFQDER